MNLAAFLLCFIFLFGVFQKGQSIINKENCSENGPSSYSSGYTQQHPHNAYSSQYIRTGSGGSSRSIIPTYSTYSAASQSGYRAGVLGENENDLQVATSHYSPSVTSYGGSSGGYDRSRTGYEQSSVTSDSQIRQKYEDLKHKADSYVHAGASPPADGLTSNSDLYGSHISSSNYQTSQRRQQQYGSASGSGNVLGVSYGTTGNEDDRQQLIPVSATIPSSSGFNRKENHDSQISYSASGSGSHGISDNIDFSISQNAPNIAPVHSSVQTSESNLESSSHVTQEFEALKHKAQAFVHEGAPPPTSQLSSNSLQQSSTHVETLPAKSTDRGTIVVPVRVTVTREQTVIPGGNGEYYNGNDLQGSSSVVSSRKESSYSSQSSSAPQTISYGNLDTSVGSSGATTYSKVPFGSSSSYSYNSEIAAGKSPQVYTVGPQGSLVLPENSDQYEAGSTHGSSNSYVKSSTVHRENVVVPGAVAISDGEDFTKKSNKLFDLVSGYGTFLPAKESEEKLSQTGTSTKVSSNTYTSSSQTGHTGSGYQPVPLNTPVKTGYTSNTYQSGYQGVTRPAYTGIPQGDPIHPPEVSGSYFSNSGYAAMRDPTTKGGYYSSSRDQKFGTSSNRDEQLSSSYGASTYGASRDQHLSSSYGTHPIGQYEINGLYGQNQNIASSIGHSNAQVSRDRTLGALALNHDQNLGVIERDCVSRICDESNLIAGGATGGGVKKYGISSSWSSKSQTVNGKTTESKQASVTVNDNGKIDTYATHNRK